MTMTFSVVTRYTDMESEDYPFFQGLVYLLENDVSTLGYELTFSTEVCFLFVSWLFYLFIYLFFYIFALSCNLGWELKKTLHTKTMFW